MAPLPPLRDGGCALPICPFGRACHPLISDAPDCKCSPGRLRFWVVWASCPGAAAPISIHAPRVGRDCTLAAATGRPPYFNPRAPCGARRLPAERISCAGRISIHAPRVGRDWQIPHTARASAHFNPRAPCGARPDGRNQLRQRVDFNPRAPCGARRFSSSFVRCPHNFNPRAPCGARPWMGVA